MRKSPRRLFFFPDYRQTNDYQNMLYSSLGEDTSAIAGTIEDAIHHIKWEPDHEVIFHLHWPEPLFREAQNSAAFSILAERFLNNIRFFQTTGGLFFWTIHNKIPHDRQFTECYLEFFRDLGKASDAIHLHSHDALEIVADLYELPRQKVSVIAHGAYVGVYPQIFDKAQARRRLSINEDAFVIGSLGQLRPYKGLDLLLEAFRQLRDQQSNVVLLLAGKSTYPTKPGTWTAMQHVVEGLRVEERFIPTEEFSLFFAAMNFVALPYTEILTSGSVMLAASFGKPMILPELPALKTICSQGFAITHERDNVQSLATALDRALKCSKKEVHDLEEKALAFARLNSWKEVSKQFAKVLETTCNFDTTKLVIDDKTCFLRAPESNPSSEIAVAIVDYFSSENSIELVDGLSSSSDIRCYVLDNSGDDLNFKKLCRALPRSVVVKSERNLGYAAGNNLLMRIIQKYFHKYILIINPDVEVSVATVEMLRKQCEIDQRAMVSPLVLKDNGLISFAGSNFVEGLDLDIHHFFDGQPVDVVPDAPYQVDGLNGCILFFKTEIFETVGGMDESFFLYYEETEWFKRAADFGVTLWIIPSLRALHKKVSHGRIVPSLYYLYYFVRGNSLFASRFGRDISGAQQRLEAGFIAGWRKRLSQTAPGFLALFEATIGAALTDGARQRTGPVNLGKRLDEVTNYFDKDVGFVEEVNEDGTFVGWVAAPVQNESGLNGVWLIINDVPVANVLAIEDREDVAKAGHALKAGFRIKLPLEFENADLLHIEIVSALSGARLPFATEKYEKAIDRRYIPKAKSDVSPVFEGRLDGIKERRLTGWAWDRANPHRRLHVKVKIEDEVFELGAADLERADLRKAGKGDGKHAFEKTLPKRFLKDATLNCELYSVLNDVLISKRKINFSPSGYGFSCKFGLSDFLRWSYVEDRMPVGAYDDAELLRSQFNYLYEAKALKARQTEYRPLVSIIMPAYNREDVIIKAITSVVDQTYANWELLIIDDGSRDSTVEVVKRYLSELRDDRLKLMIHDCNKGVSAARNTGIAASSGELICYLDTDNVWKSEALAIMTNEFASDPQLETAYAGQEIWERIDVTGELELRFIRASPFNRSRLEERNFIDLNVFIHRRSCIATHGTFNERMKRLVDWELILRYTSKSMPRFIPVLLSIYHVNEVPNQITRVENYSLALAGIKETLKTDARISEIAVRSNLKVSVLLNSDGTDITDWIHLNSDWLRRSAVSLFVINLGEAVEARQVTNLRQALARKVRLKFGAALSISELSTLIDPELSSVITDVKHIAHNGWQNAVLRAIKHGLSIVTGRKVPFSAQAQPLGDKMPQEIASYVTDWEISPALLGQVVSRLPVGWLWVSAEVVPAVLTAFPHMQEWGGTLNPFFDAGIDGHPLLCAYLPEVKVSILQDSQASVGS